MHEPELLLLSRFVEELSGRRARDAASLEARDHGPPDLQDRLVVPGPLPVSDPSDTLAAVLDDDLELPRVFLLVAGLPFDDLLRGLGTPDVLGHLRFIELHEEGKVPRPPRLDTRDGPVERIALDGHALTLATCERSAPWKSSQSSLQAAKPFANEGLPLHMSRDPGSPQSEKEMKCRASPASRKSLAVPNPGMLRALSLSQVCHRATNSSSLPSFTRQSPEA